MTFSMKALNITLKKCDSQHNEIQHNGEHCYPECHYAECHYAECHYAENRGSMKTSLPE
jgi:hypothetical protein